MLLQDFNVSVQVCGVTYTGATHVFELWCLRALAAWKLYKRKLPEHERTMAEYNGRIILTAWPSTFYSGLVGRASYDSMTPVGEALAILHRNTTSTERTPKAIKSLDKHDAPEIALQHANDALTVKAYLAQDATLLESESSGFYAQFVQNWNVSCGSRWSCTTKKISDVGKPEKVTNWKKRCEQKRLNRLVFKTVARLVYKHRRHGTGKQDFHRRRAQGAQGYKALER